MTSRTPSLPQPHAPVPPELALRYTALEVVLAALSDLGPLAPSELAHLRAQAEALSLPEHLLRRYEAALSDGLTVDGIAFNPYLQHDQVVLLVLGLVRYPALAAFGKRWAEPHGLDAAAVAFLLERAPRPAEPNPTAEALLDPPAEVLPLAVHLSLRLRLGSGGSQRVGGIAPHLYEHPWDRAALQKMRQITGFETALRKFSEWHFEKMTQLQSYSNRIRVGPDQFPEIWAIWREALERAGLSGGDEPELYVEMGGLNAFTTGVTVKQVVVSSALVSLLDPLELMFAMGHELGHIRSQHVLYSMFASWLPQLMSVIGQATLGLGSLLGKGVELAVFDWHRKSELTCDRFGLLVCQDIDAAQRTLMKLSGAPPRFFSKMNWRAFQSQAALYDGEANLHSNVYKFLLVSQQSHPWPAVRSDQLQKWIDSGHYAGLLERARGGAALSPASKETTSGRFCSQCGEALEAADAFCPGCGAKAA